MKRAVSLVMSVLLIAAMFAMQSVVSADTVGTDYYVDSVGGSDENSGTSATDAWASLAKVNATTFSAGDRILFKRGCEFKGTLYPKGSGTEAAPITISDYGNSKEPMPCINANSSDFSSARLSTAVYLYNQSHWIIENIEATNTYSSTDEQACIFICSGDGQTVYDITIQNCYAHGSATDWSGSANKGLDGIMVTTKDYGGHHDGIKIIGNTVKDCKDDGITVFGSRCGGNINGVAAAKTTNNVYIAENFLSNIGGDGILVNNCNEPVVEYNVAHKTHSYDTSYCVAMWAYSCRNALFQYNEAYLTQNGGDAQGYDCDYQCTGTTFQYNYSHDNAGGFMLICTEAKTWDGGVAYNIGSVVRYNISQNDKRTTISLVGHIEDTWIYNNTIFNSWGTTTNVLQGSQKGGPYPNNTHILNNIFYVDTGSVSLGGARNTTFSNNMIYGRVASKFPKNGDTQLVEGDDECVIHAENNIYNVEPKLYKAGGADVGFDSCSAYRIKEDSLAINAGVYVENPSAHPCKTDFFGHSIEGDTTPNIGADNSAGVAADNSIPLVSGMYQSLTDWETQAVGKTNTAIEPLSGDTSTWSSTAEIIDNTGSEDSSGLDGSRRSIKVTAKYSGSHVVALTLRAEQLKNTNGFRVWLKSDGANRSARVNIVGSGFNYYTNVSFDGAGKWCDIDFVNGNFYQESTGKADGVDKSLLPTASAIKIKVSFGTNEAIYIDDMQLYFGGIQTEYSITVGDGLLEGVAANTDYADFVPRITGTENASFEVLSGERVVTSGDIGTGMTLKVVVGDGVGKYSIVIAGDLSGDGSVTSQDLLKLKRAALGLEEIDTAQTAAGDLLENDKINAGDCLKLKRMLLAE